MAFHGFLFLNIFEFQCFRGKGSGIVSCCFLHGFHLRNFILQDMQTTQNGELSLPKYFIDSRGKKKCTHAFSEDTGANWDQNLNLEIWFHLFLMVCNMGGMKKQIWSLEKCLALNEAYLKEIGCNFGEKFFSYSIIFINWDIHQSSL